MSCSTTRWGLLDQGFHAPAPASAVPVELWEYSDRLEVRGVHQCKREVDVPEPTTYKQFLDAKPYYVRRTIGEVSLPADEGVGLHADICLGQARVDGASEGRNG